MQKLLTGLIFTTLFLFIAAALYVFEVWPFNPGGPIIEAGTQQIAESSLSQQIPEILSPDKIERNKTYDEYMSRGKSLEEKGYLALAIAEFQAAGKLEPQKADPLIQIGRMHLKSLDYLKAKVSFEEALTIEPASVNAMTYLGRTLLAMREPEKAKAVFNSIITATQASKYYQGIIAIYFGEYEKGKNLLNESLSLGGTDDLKAKAKNFLAAFDEFNSNQGGLTIHLKTLLGRSYAQTGEYQMAIPLLFSVIKEKKDYRDAWILLGYSYLNIQKYQDSIQALEEAKILDSQKPETLFFLGLAYFGVNDLQKASQNLELAKSNGFEPKVQVDQKLAEIYLQMKNYSKSAASYESVVALNNEDVEYFIRPIWIYIERLNQPAKAVALAGKALNAHPEEAMSYNLLGWAKIGENKMDEAEILLKKSLEIDPHLAAAYLNLGYLYEKKNQPQNAAAYYKRAFELGNGSSISTAAAEKYNQLIVKINSSPNATLKASLLNQ